MSLKNNIVDLLHMLNCTRNSAIAEGPHDVLCQLKSCQLLQQNYLKMTSEKACNHKIKIKFLKILKITSEIFQNYI